MIRVELLYATACNPIESASHAALECYQAEPPQMGKRINVEDVLFRPGHHTTLQHFYFTFNIEGISVGDITFGMHLASPFYNSDQRSGRFCAKMFVDPDFRSIEKYVRKFWPEISSAARRDIMKYVENGVGIYHDNIGQATKAARELICKERPFAKGKYVEQNAPKFAQEQLRTFIPVIFPTGFDYTINLSALVAIYQSAWTPAMRYVADAMADIVIHEYEELAFMFDAKNLNRKDWGVPVESGARSGLSNSPSLELLDIIGLDAFKKAEYGEMHPTDKLHFRPELMDNSVGEVRTRIEISTATMGQDQRHRTIRRSSPVFTGTLYCPPIAKVIGLENEAVGFQKKWLELTERVPSSLATIIAPYGANVSYVKVSEFNALIHEQAKRLCWCAQEEIYCISNKLRKEISMKYGMDCPLLSVLAPPCFENGKCLEGPRYCGRDIELRHGEEYFPRRSV